MLFIENRRKLIEYMINEGLVDQNQVTGKGIMKKYREMKNEIFCPGVFRDDCYEKFWLIGYEVGYKQALLGEDDVVDVPAISAPANALSRMCGEIALLHKEGYFKKIGRGIYTAAVPVSFEPKRKESNVNIQLADDSLYVDVKAKKEELIEIATKAAMEALQKLSK